MELPFISRVIGHAQGGDAAGKIHLTPDEQAKATREATATEDGLLSADEALLVDYTTPPVSDDSSGLTLQRAAEDTTLYIRIDEGWRKLNSDVWENVVDSGEPVIDEGEPVVDT